MTASAGLGGAPGPSRRPCAGRWRLATGSAGSRVAATVIAIPHHIEHWADGGRTALDNLVLLCRRHHRAVHEEGFRVTIDAAGDVRFLRPDGLPLPEAPPAPAWTGPALQPTNDGLAAAGIEIDADTATPSWRGERLDLDYAMGVLWRPRREPPAE